VTTAPEPRAALVFRAALPVGRAVAERLRAAGDRVHAVDAVPQDPRSRRAAIREAISGHGFEVLVVPAAEEPQRSARTWSADVRTLVDDALREAFFCVKDVVPNMTGGRIVLAARARGEGAWPAATLLEGAMVALVRLLAVELAPRGIALNALCPIGCRIDPSAVADGLAFLASPGASYMTGTTVPLLRNTQSAIPAVAR
jgi:3-oxoacyl-[acyl-carrier protein] reductase